MNVIVPGKRRDGGSSFVKLITYISVRDEKKLDETLSPDMPFVRPSRSKEMVFDRLVDYIKRTALPEGEHIIETFPDGRQQVYFDNVACETNCFSLDTAAAEMNMVAEENVRKKDPVYHFILSWREEDKPKDTDVFSAARYCLHQIGMGDHQFVTAIHRDTDNVHCHVAVNRVNPVSFRMADKYYALDTLQQCCRRLEAKYGWVPDNGSWVLDDQQQLVRVKREYPSAPQGAKHLEYHADQESLYTYAVAHCRDAVNTLIKGEAPTWQKLHSVLIEAGLELRQKGQGLAIYPQPRPGETETSQRPIKACRLHPEMTLSRLEPALGHFVPAPKAERLQPGKLVYGALISSDYDNRLHVRDRGARQERRVARAEAREDLKARYKMYRNSWVRPVELKEDSRTRFQALAQDYRRRGETISLINDPLLRKMMRHALAVDRMVATAGLRMELKAERETLKRQPGWRPQTYRQWVEARALEHDRAAIAQLRGWAYRAKRGDRTPALSDRVLKCAVADDIRPFNISGYETRVNRDGAICYEKDGSPAIVDKGAHIEIVGKTKRDLVAAYCLAERKSGEVLEIRGRKAFLQEAVAALPDYHKVSGKPLPLSHPTQRQWAGYEKKQIQPEEVAPKNSAQHTPGYKPG
ncbi:TraI/MobA(P) family conjugative relaxase [Klebsiella aerogenes]